MRRSILAAAFLATSACGGRGPSAPKVAPDPVAASASREEVDSLWAWSKQAIRNGKWEQAVKELERVLLEFEPGDSRVSQAHFFLGEAHFGMGSQLTAAREFRKVSDETPNDPLAPEALLRVGDAYADLWRRPELDPSYGQTALATYQELLNRFPGGPAAKQAQVRIDELQERFAYKEYKAALFYFRLKAYDSAILYLKDLVATYPRTAVAPSALIKLVEAYRTLGYKEDVKETCGYIRRFHPEAAGVGDACPSDSAGAS